MIAFAAAMMQISEKQWKCEQEMESLE